MSHNQDLEAPTIFVEAPPEEQDDLIDGGYPSSSLNSLNNNAYMNEHPDVQALYRQVYPEATTSSRALGPEQGLFSAPFDQSPLSTGQMSPLITAGLRDGSAGNIFLSPSDQNSPIDPAWSPASTSSGDVFSDNWSESSSNWSPSVHSSSPSSPSLSPLNTSFNNIALSDDNVQGPAFFRQRSNSYTSSSDSQTDLGMRPRSASFNNLASTGEPSSLYSTQQPENFIQASNEYNIPPHFQQSLSDYGVQIQQIPQWAPSVQNEPPANTSTPSFDTSVFFDQPNQWNSSAAAVSNFAPNQFYSPPPGPPPSHSHSPSHGRSLSTHLTVPTVPSLQRRDAHRRSHSHTGVQDSVRGRKRYSPTASTSSRPSSQSREPSPSSPVAPLDFPPYLNFGPGSFGPGSQTNSSNEYLSPTSSSTASSPQGPISPSDFLSLTSPSSSSPQSLTGFSEYLSPTSPSSSSSHSPTGGSDRFYTPELPSSSPQSSSSTSITINVPDTQPDSIPVAYSGGVMRRHTFGAGSRDHSRSSSPVGEREPSASTAQTLHRAASDPIGQKRRKRAPTAARKFPGLLKPAKEVDEAGPPTHDGLMINVPIEGVHSAQPAAEYKSVVGSDKIVQASNLRRKNLAKFVCTICDHRFTAKHNLMNHMNSHTNKRPHECSKCGNTFTTRGTHARHESICSGRPVRKR